MKSLNLPMATQRAGLVLSLLLCWITLFSGGRPRFDERLKPAKQPPQVCYEVPYVDNEIAESYANLAYGTKGNFYSAIDQPLIVAIHKVLSENLVSGADVVFVIDHTSSMKDDIEEVRGELKSIIEQLESRDHVRLGAVSFSDVKSGSLFGYRSLDLSMDYHGMAVFLDDIELLGSVEDIYGAVWKTVDEFTWQSRTKRMIVIIGDEKPATGNETDYSEEDVINKCQSMAISANLYPILIDKNE